MEIELSHKGPEEPSGPECHGSKQSFWYRQVEPACLCVVAGPYLQPPAFSRTCWGPGKQTEKINIETMISPIPPLASVCLWPRASEKILMSNSYEVLTLS